MKFSIVTISFNQVSYLEKCIKSVLNQDNVEVEYIVVDPGSTDGSRDLISAYKDKISHVILEPDNGPADGLNKGFKFATGDIFGFINSDDYFLPGALSKVSEYFNSLKNIDVLLGSGFFVDGLGNKIGKVTPSKFTAERYVHGSVTLFQQGAFFKSKIFKEIGGFNIANRVCWDGELFLDMAIRGARFQPVPEEFAAFRMDGGNISSGEAYLNKLKVENDRIFVKVYQRDRSSIDKAIGYFFRFVKIADLSYVYRRLRSWNISRPPHLR